MNHEEARNYLNKQVKLYTKSKFTYTGNITQSRSDHFVLIEFNNREVTIFFDQIAFIVDLGAK